MEKPTFRWQDRVRSVSEYHISMIRDNPNWRVLDTANELKRSKGRISEDLKLASWLITHGDYLERIETAQEAMEWIKKRERDQRLLGIRR